jgi:hypothetical protein
VAAGISSVPFTPKVQRLVAHPETVRIVSPVRLGAPLGSGFEPRANVGPGDEAEGSKIALARNQVNAPLAQKQMAEGGTLTGVFSAAPVPHEAMLAQSRQIIAVPDDNRGCEQYCESQRQQTLGLGTRAAPFV